MGKCRICDRDSDNLHDVFSKNSDGKQILQLIRESLPVVIYGNDPLSKEICTPCLNDINKVYNIRKNCLDVIDKHKQFLKDSEDKSALLYLQLLEDTDQEELWMYSCPIKKNFTNENVCSNCKNECKPEKPFRKYKEAIRRIPESLPLTNGHEESLDNAEGLLEVTKKRKRVPVLDKEMVTSGAHAKRRRIIGPKSISQPFVKSSYVEATVYNPLSLLCLSLNVINKSIVTDLITDDYKTEKVYNEVNEYICEYCFKVFGNEEDLARHESGHMRVDLSRVDNMELWNLSFDDAEFRNNWLRQENDNVVIVEEDDDDNEDGDDDSDNLLMPLNETGEDLVDGEIEIIDGKPMVNGILLSSIPKNERKRYYNKNYVVSGVRRKFCHVCRYTFKDNWAIELHYFSGACNYTCKYCGVRFNKQKQLFEDHVNKHVARGDPTSDKVYISKKKNDPVPRIVNDKGVITVDSYTEELYKSTAPIVPVLKAVKTKTLLERPSLSPTASSDDVDREQSQAYFCRKCYKVFFKLDEFNQHTNICDGRNDEDDVIEPRRKYQRTSNSEAQRASPEPPPPAVSRSSTGRPVRNCVRDVKYRDHVDIEETRRSSSSTQDGAQHKGCECVICGAAFQSVLARNSHMRVHRDLKGQQQHARSKQNDGRNASRYVQRERSRYGENSNAYYNSYDGYDDVPIKQESLEPLVEIHESSSSSSQSTSGGMGAVSITPIPNKKHRTSINPDIMKLVQSNPNITIRNLNNEPIETDPMMDDDSSRTYKCSSCSTTFNNKSALYFHKKHNCVGSRYPCPFCKKRFGTESEYSAHIYYSHPE